ncbi:hypothetical protein PVAP13_1KG321305 [Panicum virgatum]|uniref:Uncharacterized protein n=1 Tax=Panicum virgatum TaxID=38727 RepID=A0A8T0XFP6_PANVG|nr:hypothetical protein PVAP13_1KG321305 [Panicum virgatum]
MNTPIKAPPSSGRLLHEPTRHGFPFPSSLPSEILMKSRVRACIATRRPLIAAAPWSTSPPPPPPPRPSYSDPHHRRFRRDAPHVSRLVLSSTTTTITD